MKYADKDVLEMEEFFKSAQLPETIELFNSTVITDVKAFVHSHLLIMRLRKGVPLFEVFYERLVLVRKKLEENAAG